MNAMVGGGSFVTLPALVATGLSALEANASSSVALYPGGALSAFVYRGAAGFVGGVPVRRLMLVSILGGCAGAALLLWTPTRLFDRVLPWLLLTATILLAFGPRLVRLHEISVRHGRRSVLGIQLLLGIYAGYFGGAVGLLMIAAWRVLGEHDIKSLHDPPRLGRELERRCPQPCLLRRPVGGTRTPTFPGTRPELLSGTSVSSWTMSPRW